MTPKQTILFTTPVLHHPPIGGPTLRVENSIKALSQIANLYIYSRVYPAEMGGDQAIKFYQQKYCQQFYFAPFVDPNINFLDKFQYLLKKRLFKDSTILLIKIIFNKFSRKFLNKNIFEIYYESETDYQKLLDIAEQIQADIIWLGYGNISYPLLKYIKENSHYKVVLDTDSVWSRYVKRELLYAKNEEQYQQIYQSGQQKIEEETWGTKLADITTAVSEIDAEYYRELAEKSEQIQIFSNVIDLDTYQKTPPIPQNFQSPSIYLAGTFWAGSPMEDAARWVIEKVFPLVRQKIPNIHFYIIGNNSDIILSDIKDSQITITGKIESVLPYLYHVNIALVPLRFESGTRFKILEAGACRIPVISTTLGAEGIPVTDGHNILIADEPETFAEAILRLIQDPQFADQISTNLHQLIRQQYTISTLVSEGKNILSKL